MLAQEHINPLINKNKGRMLCEAQAFLTFIIVGITYNYSMEHLRKGMRRREGISIQRRIS